jgi:hypothetical protein
MPDVYELMYLPRLHLGSFVLVTSRGSSVAVRIFTDGVSSPRRIDGKELPSLVQLATEARAAGKPILPQDALAASNTKEWFKRISRANEQHGLASHVGVGAVGPLPRSPAPSDTGIALAASRTVFVSHSGTPLRSLVDWQALHPPHHWKAGYSAMELARTWHLAQGFPPAVAEVLARGPFRTLVVEKGIAECLTAVPGAGRPSHTDLMVEARGPGTKVVLGVEGKVHESFGPRVDAWLAKEEPGRSRSNKDTRLRGLCEGLGLSPDAPSTRALRYQLLHRSWAALAHAKATGAHAAVLLVHSLADGGDVDNVADYRAFLRALGADGDVGELTSLGDRGGMPFWAVWVRDRPLAG